jgi:hypothetical protein
VPLFGDDFGRFETVGDAFARMHDCSNYRFAGIAFSPAFQHRTKIHSRSIDLMAHVALGHSGFAADKVTLQGEDLFDVELGDFRPFDGFFVVLVGLELVGLFVQPFHLVGILTPAMAASVVEPPSGEGTNVFAAFFGDVNHSHRSAFGGHEAEGGHGLLVAVAHVVPDGAQVGSIGIDAQGDGADIDMAIVTLKCRLNHLLRRTHCAGPGRWFSCIFALPLAHFKVPHEFQFLPERPKTAIGEIQRITLRGRRANLERQ